MHIHDGGGHREHLRDPAPGRLAHPRRPEEAAARSTAEGDRIRTTSAGSAATSSTRATAASAPSASTRRRARRRSARTPPPPICPSTRSSPSRTPSSSGPTRPPPPSDTHTRREPHAEASHTDPDPRGARLLATAVSASARASLQDVRNSTAKFRHLAVAKHDGYGLLKDAAGIACIDNPPVGGMGIHYVNGTLVGDAKVNPRKPEALVYQPIHHHLRLVAVEYVVFQDAWTAVHPNRKPELFGRKFELLGRTTATACRRSTSCTPGSGSTTRAGCSTTGTPASTARPERIAMWGARSGRPTDGARRRSGIIAGDARRHPHGRPRPDRA